MMQRTFGMIKPDAVRKGKAGAIIKRIEEAGFTVVRMEKRTLSKELVKVFYDIHKERPFFGEMVDFITSGPVVTLMLEKADAVLAWRQLMGATNPASAEQGTLRKEFGASIGENAVHGSDAPETAARELGLFFNE